MTIVSVTVRHQQASNIRITHCSVHRKLLTIFSLLVKFFCMKRIYQFRQVYHNISSDGFILQRVPIVFTLSSFEYSIRKWKMQCNWNVKPSVSASPTKRTFIWIQSPVTRITVCGLTLNLSNWLSGKSLPLRSWCRPTAGVCIGRKGDLYFVGEKVR